MRMNTVAELYWLEEELDYIKSVDIPHCDNAKARLLADINRLRADIYCWQKEDNFKVKRNFTVKQE